MRALAAAGRQAEALAVYQRTRDLLAEDLGVDPSQQLAQAYLAVLRQEIPVAAARQTAGRRRAAAPGGRLADGDGRRRTLRTPNARAPGAVAAAGASRPASSAGTATWPLC